MNRLKALLRAAFHLSRGEASGFLILLPLMFLVLFSNSLFRLFESSRPLSLTEYDRLDSALAAWQWPSANKEQATSAIQFVKFNPNTVQPDALQAMGLAARPAMQVQRYRDAGGRFTVKNDLLKIYAMDTAWFRLAYAWIDLPETVSTSNTPTNTPLREQNTAKKVVNTFDINAADTTQLKVINGIGSKLAQRIVKYRAKLGGFTSMMQLNEVYGLDSAVIARLKEKAYVATNFVPDKVPLNSANEQLLAEHPYIGKQLARSIASYRYQHGNFTALTQLMNLQLMDSVRLQKIERYLSLD